MSGRECRDEGFGFDGGFAFIVVLFILLIIVGASFVGGGGDF
ncbi:YjcZ family sporulation protein [Peribacillus simplex]